MSDQKASSTDVDRSTTDQQNAAALVTNSNSVAPNYGTMESTVKKDSDTSVGKFAQDNQQLPKPAVRRKIQQQTESPMQETIQMGQKMDEMDQKVEKSDNAKQIVGLPSVKDFEVVHEHEASATHSSRRSKDRSHRPYPKKVFFIVANEFCERFSYYGLRTVLVLYFKSVLGYSDSASTVSFHLFTTLCYLTPILGAILGDSIWGKYKTILYLSMVYFLGEFVLVLSSIFWDLNMVSALMTFSGLLLIGIGTGGIKPCVSAFGGDQFLPHETKRRESFFSLFYAAINLGSLISMFVTPMLRSNYQCVNRSDCYPYAFALPCGIMLLAIIVFLAAHQYYTVTPLPETNMIVAFFKCVCLALKRKVFGHNGLGTRPAGATRAELADGSVPGGLASVTTGDSSSGSNLSMASGPDEHLVARKSQRIIAQGSSSVVKVGKGLEEVDSDHWLYLASDKFDQNSIEEFRSVLGIFLLFLPASVYWCLFDQQGSLWILQATKMDGRIPGTNFTLDPDQMMVANPVLLLTSILLFQTLFYPALNKCNLLTSSIQRMTAGGLIAASAFVASALIEFHIQQNLPPQTSPNGTSSFLLVNGLTGCSIFQPTISYANELSPPQLMVPEFGLTDSVGKVETLSDETYDHVIKLKSIDPLSSVQFSLMSKPSKLNDYKFTFRLANGSLNPNPPGPPLVASPPGDSMQTTCPLDFNQTVELTNSVWPDQMAKMLYLQHGNGKLSLKLFNDSMALPKPSQAKVRLLYEYFGATNQALVRQFKLVKISDENSTRISEHPFTFDVHDGLVLLSNYTDIPISSSHGDRFILEIINPPSTASPISWSSTLSPEMKKKNIEVILKPGTRNFLIVHQQDSKNFQLSQQLLQDNSYRVSMLLQLIPYYLISTSEVMFSITGLEFSYKMAPDSMKSLILGAWSLTTAMGNLLTVAVESIHLFDNLAHDFLFYAGLLVVDMLVFAFIGYHYKPYRRKSLTSVESV